ncbi:hypothetical protein PG994_007863 [Apiospora phragmitis]|uniref:Acetylserotonin methytransferase-like protein n=1 Tax=Apiospora phragmitis TaxID=2905665 RepID=A0ABR1URH3_9PEZI
MASPSTGATGGFSLFPNTNPTKPPSRKTTPRPRAETPQSSTREPRPSLEMTPPRNHHGRRTPENDLSQYVIDGSPLSASGGRPGPYSSPTSQAVRRYREEPPAAVAVSQTVPVSEAPPRTDTAYSGTSTLVRDESHRSRSSIAKRPIVDEEEDQEPLPSSLSNPDSHGAEAGLRSIFPQYDHNLPFDRQDYYPTQTSPRHIPRQVISRQSRFPPQQDEEEQPESQNPQQPVRSPVRSPMSAGSTQMQQQRWPTMPNPRRYQDPPVIPPVSTTEDLKDYWKAANGWKASASQGRTFCMKLTSEKDAPIYHLSSTSQGLYHLKINPTSASAYVTLSRHDPSKPFKARDPAADRPSGILAALREAHDKNRTWQEAISTTLEEEARRLPPHDGLVALLYPSAATKMALDKPGDSAAVAAAERECARLVWDEDSRNYFLAHPALATPFCVTVERNPAWSRTEYMVEHIESPQHLAKLTRDGTGDGYLELDTAVAGRIEAYYILDVAVCALMLVANLDERHSAHVEQFEPPPPPPPPLVKAPSSAHLRDSLMSRLSGRPSDEHLGGINSSKNNKNKKNKKGKAGKHRFEEFELDLESQASSLGKQLEVRDRDKLPGCTRTVMKLVSFAFKCVIWTLTLIFKSLVAIISGLSKCLTSEKL